MNDYSSLKLSPLKSYIIVKRLQVSVCLDSQFVEKNNEFFGF